MGKGKDLELLKGGAVDRVSEQASNGGTVWSDPDYPRLVAAQSEFAQAFHRARVLGSAMVAEFDRMNEARALLRDEGIKITVEFPSEIQAAMIAHRDLFSSEPTAESHDLPDWIEHPAR
jgi:hypothetical protein